MRPVKDLLLDAPIIAAVKDTAGLQRALQSDCRVIFLLFGTLVNIGGLVRQIKAADKLCVVHIDMVDGLSNREVAVDGLVAICHPDGIISTRPPQIRRAHQLGILAIQRIFLLDSLSLQSLSAQIETACPDYVEILPGIIPTIIREITEKTDIPLIAGGLIRSKQDVIQALQAGAVAVSSSCADVWKM